MTPVTNNLYINTDLTQNPLADRETLMEAISNGDLDTVQRVIAYRDARGVPYVNLNSGYGNASTALMWALWKDPINETIVGVLLDARDHAGYPIVDLNRLGPHGQSIFSFILSLSCNRLRRSLLQRVLDVRDPHGELIADVRTDECNIPLLKQALSKNDIDCLKILLDVRLSTGERALNINEIRHRTTVLDKALETDDPCYHYNQEIVEVIRAAGGLTHHLIPTNQQTQTRRPQPARRNPPIEPPPILGVIQPQAIQRINPHDPAPQDIGNNAEPRFNQDTQNTHDPSVTQTAKGSLEALRRLYPMNDKLEEDTAIKQIDDLVESFDYTQLIIDRSLSAARKKELAKSCLELVKNRFDTTHSYTNLKMKTIFFLVWKAVIDDRLEVYPDEIRHTLDPKLTEAPLYLVQTKKSSLIEKFIEASLAYNGEIDICVGGLIHKLLETLNHAHNSVTICTGSLAVRPAANQIPSVVAKRFLEKKPIREQKQILSGWEDGQEATTFRNSLKKPIKEELKQRFGTLIDAQIINDIISVLEYIQKPVMHSRLEELIGIIQQIPDNADRPLIAKMKGLTKQAYAENDRPFQEEFELLHRTFINFLTQLPANELTESFASQVKYIEGADQIAACPNNLVCYLTAEQIPLLTAEQISYIPQDKLTYLIDPKIISSVSKWNFVYLNQVQLQHHPDLRVYIAIMSTVGVIINLVSLVCYVALPTIRIFNQSTAKKTEKVLNLNFKRLQHLCLDAIPGLFHQRFKRTRKATEL